ncbi:MAG: anti-sigma F factor [Eubacteriales bacterium]|jgi:stage II sporulation protein AB (anti-sigma F factor)
MKVLNEMKITCMSKSANEAFARVAVSSFVAQLDPTVEELTDIRTAVSEAVTNAIVHGYGNELGIITLQVRILEDAEIEVVIRDKGKGMEDVKQAMQPLYTTCETGERAGMGFTIMETFMDRLRVTSRPGKGTTVRLRKRLRLKE